MRLVHAVYDITAHFPDNEKSGMILMLRRTSTRIPTILADSHYQQDPSESARRLATAEDTLRELYSYLDIAERLRLTRRWRFRRPRRRAQATAANLDQMRERILESGG